MSMPTIDRRGFVFAGAAALFCPSLAHAAASSGLEAVIASGSVPIPVFEGGRWCEGPAWDRRTGTLVFSDVRADRLLGMAADGQVTILRNPARHTNGNAFDAAGRLVSCEHLGRRVVRQERDGRLTVLADRFGGKRLNSPNDLAIARDGAIWFTDPTFGLEQPEEGRMASPEQSGRFVFRIDPAGALTVVADSFEQPNGIAFSSDERTLYVSDTSGGDGREGKREIRAFDVFGAKLSKERVFATVPSGVPDGLAVDIAGRVYAATDRGATVWAPDGATIGIIPTPSTCGNLAFGGVNGRRLFLCNGSTVHAIDTRTRGALGL